MRDQKLPPRPQEVPEGKIRGLAGAVDNPSECRTTPSKEGGTDRYARGAQSLVDRKTEVRLLFGHHFRNSLPEEPLIHVGENRMSSPTQKGQ